MQKKYREIVSTRRNMQSAPIFNDACDLRYNSESLTPATLAINRQFGMLCDQLWKDSNRDIHILEKDSCRQYEELVATLRGDYYWQGDLTARSDLLGIRMLLTNRNNVNYVGKGTPNIWNEIPGETPLIKEQFCSYLREDGSLGGVTVVCDSYTGEWYCAVMHLPKYAESYSEAEVHFFYQKN